MIASRQIFKWSAVFLCFLFTLPASAETISKSALSWQGQPVSNEQLGTVLGSWVKVILSAETILDDSFEKEVQDQCQQGINKSFVLQGSTTLDFAKLEETVPGVSEAKGNLFFSMKDQQLVYVYERDFFRKIVQGGEVQRVSGGGAKPNRLSFYTTKVFRKFTTGYSLKKDTRLGQDELRKALVLDLSLLKLGSGRDVLIARDVTDGEPPALSRYNYFLRCGDFQPR